MFQPESASDTESKSARESQETASKQANAGPVIFVVERHAGREIPGLYFDVTKLPTQLTKHQLIVYALRLDKLPNGEELAKRPLDQLYAMFVHLRKMGTLPPSNLADPPAKIESRKGSIIGEWWEPPPATWDRNAPGFSFPKPGELKPKPDALAYIGPDKVAAEQRRRRPAP